MTPELFKELTGTSLESMACQCHAASLALVRSGYFTSSRVARGVCSGVSSQHSWVVVGDDCYARDAMIVDPTLWSYDNGVDGIWVGSAVNGRHRPHGSVGSIWTHGSPPLPVGPVIELAVKLGSVASSFMEMAAPQGLDDRGWRILAHSPVTGWPAAEIISAMYQTPELRAIPPIDIVGMLTDHNPSGLYR